ncbi:hypothetical protein Acr_00g0045370 [Actinidia rufa]|uniref:CCHC-type domain-containing protein n=1 Tax=Actinidia rufa TaxID=165716 RepID=A0A7J0DJC2_9ERIC|nr:hypothetical protein Acr_00g0045370 [Actinidia rufa]
MFGGVGGAPPTVFGGAEFMGYTPMVEDRGRERGEEYEAKFISLSRFEKAFVSTEEGKAKQFMRELRSSITNKITENLIKVYSTMVSSVTTIEETLNETRKISFRALVHNQRGVFRRSQRILQHNSNILLGQQRQSQQRGQSHSQSQGQSQVRGPFTCFPCGQVGHITRQCTPEGEQSGSYEIATTYSVSSNLEGYSSIHFGSDFISVWTTSCSSAGSEDAGTGLRYDISSATTGQQEQHV